MREQGPGVGVHESARRFLGPSIILLAAFVAVAPQLVRGNSCGHDFDFHLVSWFDALRGWREGIAYPRWASSLNYGAGSSRFVFYPPLTWMLGAALGLALPWTLVPIALTFLLLAGTGFGTRALARQVLAEGPATLAGCTALFSGYALFTAYERSDFAEMAGGFWIPLLLFFALRDRKPDGPLRRRAFDGSTVPLALTVAGAWLSNDPVGVMASYLLAAAALAAALFWRSWAPVLRASTGTVLGLGLASIYLLPAAWEQRWVEVNQAIDDPTEMIQNSWMFARHGSPAMQPHDAELLKVSIIGASMFVLALAGLIACWRRGWFSPPTSSAVRSCWAPLAIIPFVVLFLQFPVSQPVWNLLPELRFLQFPWRWLVVLEAPMAIFFAAAIWPLDHGLAWRRRRTTVIAACAAAFLGAAVFTGLYYFQVCDEEDAVLSMWSVFRSGAGSGGDDEYAVLGTDDTRIAAGLPQACLVRDPATELGTGAEDAVPTWRPGLHSCDATFSAAPNFGKPAAEHLRIDAIVGHSGYLVLRLCSYPAWRVKVNGRLITSLPRREDGLMAVPVPAGPINLTVDWTATPDVRVGRSISAIALLLLTCLCVLERKWDQARL